MAGLPSLSFTLQAQAHQPHAKGQITQRCLVHSPYGSAKVVDPRQVHILRFRAQNVQKRSWSAWQTQSCTFMSSASSLFLIWPPVQSCALADAWQSY